MLTFKPAAGSIVEYKDTMGNHNIYLITSYGKERKSGEIDYKGIANLLDLDTGKDTFIIVAFTRYFTPDISYNKYLTVIG